MAQIIQMRRGNAAQWTSVNPVLAQGEIGVELDTHKWKVGDGAATWSALPYATGGQGPPGPTGPAGPQGPPGASAAQSAAYVWTTATGAPAAGRLGMNQATWAAATQINIAKTRKDGTDVTLFVTRIAPGDELGIQVSADSTRYGKYLVTAAAVDQGTWFSVAVTHEAHGGVEPANNADATLLWFTQGQQVEEWLGGAGAPANSLGHIGDWYLDTGSGNVYEKTGSAAWTNRGNIKGPAGAQGATGPAGATGAQGPQGTQGIPGPGVPVGGANGQALVKKSATDYDTQWATPAVSGSTEVWVGPNAPAPRDQYVWWVDTDEIAPAVPTIPLVTSLPANPADGQEVYFLADSANGVVWHLRYRAASTSPYKWERVGGEALYADADPLVSSGSTSYVALSGDPAVTVPLAGDYVIDFGAGFYNTTLGGVYTSFAVGATGASDNDYIPHDPTVTGGFNITGTRKRKKAAVPAGATIAMRFRCGGGTGNWKARYLSATPIRVG